uniref:Uncharacterized protein n=1 Tax=Rhizophora mucronata TaxID=61149 RepID=A0A2P2PEI3_RHIMU
MLPLAELVELVAGLRSVGAM